MKSKPKRATRRPPMLRLHTEDLVIDNFAGGGGASLGIEWALGRSPDIAVNHDPEALAMHAANHPDTKHLCESVWDVDPRKVCGDKQVELAWFSPDCTYHSKARGGKPFRDRNKARRRRGLAWVVVRWAEARKPRLIMLENVEEFEDWGPLLDDGTPDKTRAGFTFRRWVARLRNLGYDVDWRQLRACDYGAPTTRKRLFLIARCDGLPIVWPEATHAPPAVAAAKGLKPYRTAAECIDWSIPCPSIFLTNAEGKKIGVKRPLSDNTLRRIARGIKKFVLDAKDPFIVPDADRRPKAMVPFIAPVSHTGVRPSGTSVDARVHSINEPLPTVTGARRGEKALVQPFLTPVKTWGGGGNEPRSINEPMRTTTTSKRGEHAIVAPLLARIGQTGGNGDYSNDARTPLTTVTTKAEHLLIAPTLIQTSYGERKGQKPRTLDLHAPLGTVVGQGVKHSVVSAFLAKHYGGPGVERITKQPAGTSMDAPVDTITQRDHHTVIEAQLEPWLDDHDNTDPDGAEYEGGFFGPTIEASHLVHLRGGVDDHPNTAQAVEEPLPTVTANGNHIAEVRALLIKYYGTDQDPQLGEPLHTVTTKDRFALIVTIHGVDYEIVDIGMRMLSPRELFRAQGFPDSYDIESEWEGVKLTKTSQVRMCGNAVSPVMSEALAKANYVRRMGDLAAGCVS